MTARLNGTADFPCLLLACEAASTLLCIPPELLYMRRRAKFLAEEIEAMEAATATSG